MIYQNPFYMTPRGGSITVLTGESGRMFLSCSLSSCAYASNLHAAKSYLDRLELKKRLPFFKSIEISAQRKTTLKWQSDGELSSIDMARIVERLGEPQLSKCELACDYDNQK